MKKNLKRLGILGLVVGVLYIGYLFFIMPNGFTTQEGVVASFITNIDSSSACEEHFNKETTDLCEVLQENLDGTDVVFKSGRKTSDGMDIVLTIGENDIDFTVTFLEYSPSRL